MCELTNFRSNKWKKSKKKISCNKLFTNNHIVVKHKKINDIPKPLEEFEGKNNVNYYDDYEV